MRKFLPYAPAGMPGTWFWTYHMIPDVSGAYHPGNIFSQRVGAGPATPGTTLRAWCALLLSDAAIGYIGTTTKLYEYDGTSTFTDRSKVGGYTNTATDWSFAQYGNITLATNRVDAMQTRDSAGVAVFADATGSPAKARIVLTQAEQVLLFDLNDGAEKQDAFAACAPGDYTDWSGAGATTPTRIRHRPGKITAAVAFRDYVLAFKRNSVYKLSYTGSTFKWRVELIAVGRGAWGRHDVVNCGDVVVFSGPGGAWMFDGASFRNLTEYVGEVTTPANPCIGSVYAPLSGNVFFFRTGNPAYTYNLISDRWGLFYNTTTTNDAASTYRPLTGEPAALAAFTAYAATTPDMVWIVDLSLNPSVLKADTYWGNGNGNIVAYLIGGVEGMGGDQIMAFSRLYVDYTNSVLIPLSDITPGDTELRLDIWAANSKDALNLNPFGTGATAVQTAIASSTEQMRFDFYKSAVYARFQIKLPSSSGYVEINDYEPVMKKNGVM